MRGGTRLAAVAVASVVLTLSALHATQPEGLQVELWPGPASGRAVGSNAGTVTTHAPR